MNVSRRRFLELLGTAAVGSTVAYSFPSIIVPRNLAVESMWVYPTQFAVPMKLYDLAPNGLMYLIDNRARVLQAWAPWVPPSRETATIP